MSTCRSKEETRMSMFLNFASQIIILFWLYNFTKNKEHLSRTIPCLLFFLLKIPPFYNILNENRYVENSNK